MESPEDKSKGGHNIIDFSQHRRRRGETRSALPSFRESFYRGSASRAPQKKGKRHQSLRGWVLFGLQLVIVVFGIAVVFRGCLSF